MGLLRFFNVDIMTIVENRKSSVHVIGMMITQWPLFAKPFFFSSRQREIVRETKMVFGVCGVCVENFFPLLLSSSVLSFFPEATTKEGGEGD